MRKGTLGSPQEAWQLATLNHVKAGTLLPLLHSVNTQIAMRQHPLAKLQLVTFLPNNEVRKGKWGANRKGMNYAQLQKDKCLLTGLSISEVAG